MRLLVQHYAQVPCEPFKVEVDSIEKAMLLEEVFANQHCFLFDKKIIPDYCNVITVQIWNKDEQDWSDCDEEGNDWETIQELYLEKQPKFKHLRFETKKEFEEWLYRTYTFRIELVGLQDLTTIFIAESGEILHTNLQSSIWCGKFADVDLSKHDEINYIKIFNNDLLKWETTDLEIEKIIPNTK